MAEKMRKVSGRLIMDNPEHQKIVDSLGAAADSRRRFMKAAMMAGAAVSAGGLMLPRFAHAVAPEIAYPLGKDAVAKDIQGAIKFWLTELAKAAPDTGSDVKLTAVEKSELKGMKLTVGHTWYGLFVPAVAGWNRFWGADVDEWAAKKVVYDVQGKPERDVAGVQLMLEQKMPIVGTLAVDWVVMSEAMRKLHAATVPSTSVITPSSAYFPTTSTIMSDQVENARSLVLPMAKRLRAEGNKEADVVLLTAKSPAFYDVTRNKGFYEGIKSDEVQQVCKMKVVAERPVATGTQDAQAVTASILQQFPKVKCIAALGHWFAGSSAAIRDAGRKDVFVIAFDLDQATAADLLTGGWPVYTTYSLPIAQSSHRDADIMGKILLGKKVPLLVKTIGTTTTPENVAAAWAHDWNGEKPPF
jgi:ribose transport system substrate-binding protein